MALLKRFVGLWRYLFRRNQTDQELGEEVRFYLESLIERKIERGIDPVEARRLSILEIGGAEQVKERVREVGMGHWLETLMSDIRYGIQLLLKKPGFTGAAVIALALGIGANTAIFSAVNALVLNALPIPRLDRLVTIYERVPSRDVDHNELTPANYLDLRNQNQSFEGVGLYRWWGANLTDNGEPERVQAFLITDNFLDVVGVKPALGRNFRPEEAQSGNDRVIIISNGLWQRRFGGDPAIIGKTVAVNSTNRTIIGVMPRDYAYPKGGELFAPLVFTPDVAGNRGNHAYLCTARLKEGVSVAQAGAEVDSIYRRIESLYPETNTGRGAGVVLLAKDEVRQYAPALLILMCAVGFVLLIGCANVGNLMLARATARTKEIALRSALGASRRRIIQQLLTESVVLALMGGMLGILIGFWTVRLLKVTVPSEITSFIYNWSNVRLDFSVLLFTAGISMASGILFGLAPAFQASRIDLNEAIKNSGGSGIPQGRRHRLHNALVISEIALSMILLIAAGLMMRSFVALIKTDPGFKSENVLTMSLILPTAKYRDDTERASFFKELSHRVESLPGVESAGIVNHIPLGDSNSSTAILIQGQPEPRPGQEYVARYRVCTPDYFKALGITLIQGRAFSDADSANSTPVIIVNQALARRYWPNSDPLGKQMRLSGALDANPLRVVVGVIADVKHSLDTPITSEFYLPYAQDAWNSGVLVTHTRLDPRSIATAVRGEVKSLDPEQPVFDVRTMDDVRIQSTFVQHICVYLLGVFAGLAIILAAVGIYGVMSYSVSQRTQEIGVRMALGAGTRDVLKMIIGHGMFLTMVGTVVGLIISFGVTQVMSGLLYGVGATDPATFGSISLLVVLVSLGACYLPARRAMKVDPMRALKYE